MIGKDKWEKLFAWMSLLGIHDTELTEQFIIGSGKGGQKLHKTASTVQLKHNPSGVEIKCQDSRSREDNRYFARMRLCEKLHNSITGEKTKKQEKIDKLKRQKKRRLRRSTQNNISD